MHPKVLVAVLQTLQTHRDGWVFLGLEFFRAGGHSAAWWVYLPRTTLTRFAYQNVKLDRR
ncbi:hypothetical protein PISMIDRAFT_397320 [Pisolithus microcarpus 441]|uniref:Uncharacterized protein n=1 Tax=Pisolithus microcarpus 441 TaxID=765257 RepID=A0A0C9ZFC1_9AGAM|nr:hypothetical protein PISMIDRAFT_397320 [Pisolithus microcarpus 441]